MCRGIIHKSHKDELIEIGFDFEKQPHGGIIDWNRIKSTLLHYKYLYGHLKVPTKFIIPAQVTNEKWPILQRYSRYKDCE